MRINKINSQPVKIGEEIIETVNRGFVEDIICRINKCCSAFRIFAGIWKSIPISMLGLVCFKSVVLNGCRTWNTPPEEVHMLQ